MPPPRRSALEVSFPDLAADDEDDVETVTRTAPSSVRKDSKRKSANSLVDARVSGPHFCSSLRVVMSTQLRGAVATEASSVGPKQRKL